MRVVSVVGARPQFIKAWPVSRALARAGIEEFLVHSGQHYDDRMSQVFFDELALAAPARHLGVGSGTHAEQTGRTLVALEPVLLELRPDVVIVFGDTNTTLGGALAATKLGFPVAHVEAGLRSFRRDMPEEVNRLVADHCADLLFCPTQTAVDNLSREGVHRGVHFTGDVMYDAVLHFGSMARERSRVLERLELARGDYFLATIHRASSTDHPETLAGLMRALVLLDAAVVFPVHPRTQARLREQPALLQALRRSRVRLIDPAGYLDMLMLEQSARAVLTDSGGVQKEAYFLRVPCVTLRDETEWVETVDAGWNTLAGSDPLAIVEAALKAAPAGSPDVNPFGDGRAAEHIAAALRAWDD